MCFRFVAALFRLGLRTLVGTGSRQQHISQSQASLWGNVPGGNNRGGTFRGGFSVGECAGHQPKTTPDAKRRQSL